MDHNPKHIPILDGWRALSILFVLAGHWLPLGPSGWKMNESIAASGMALFFCLSGFLITQFLYADQRIGIFLVKRIFRIAPLAWLAITILVIANGVSLQAALANFLFFANLPPAQLMAGGEHLWSLCVEMQFYIFMALLVLCGGRRALFLIPVLTVCVTLLRIYDSEVISIVTWHRVDEIFIGGCVALAWNSPAIGNVTRRLSPYASPILLIGLLLVSLPQAAALGYLRPYIAGAAVLASLYAFPQPLYRLWTCMAARYIAQISYALYVVHGMLTATPLGGHEASKTEKYLLRIPLFLLTWAISHLSTFYFERTAISFGGRLAKNIGARRSVFT
jgi:peptidoglycan/LPS O-acetylase OafA/YrhL